MRFSIPRSLSDAILEIFGERLAPEEVVRRILSDVRLRGDDALRDWTRQIDRIEIRVLTRHDGTDPGSL